MLHFVDLYCLLRPVCPNIQGKYSKPTMKPLLHNHLQELLKLSLAIELDPDNYFLVLISSLEYMSWYLSETLIWVLLMSTCNNDFMEKKER